MYFCSKYINFLCSSQLGNIFVSTNVPLPFISHLVVGPRAEVGAEETGAGEEIGAGEETGAGEEIGALVLWAPWSHGQRLCLLLPLPHL